MTKAKKKTARRRDRDATKLALLEAAETLFAEHGYKGATVDMIAASAKANKALVSYYFGGKSGLYDDVISHLVRNVLADVRASKGDPLSPVEDMRRYIGALATAFAARPSFGAILMREYIGGAMQERARPFQDVLQFFEMTEAIYEAGRASGAFRDVDPHKLHLTIVGPLVHFTLTIGFRERTFSRVEGRIENPSVAAFADHLADMVVFGLATNRSTGAAQALDH